MQAYIVLLRICEPTAKPYTRRKKNKENVGGRVNSDKTQGIIKRKERMRDTYERKKKGAK